MYNKKEILQALCAGGEGAPLLPVPPPAQSMSPWGAAQLTAVRGRALAYLKSPAPVLPYHLFRLYWETGDRLLFQQAYFERRARLLVFSLMAWAEAEEPTWLHALEDILWEICGEPFWCIPAHFMTEHEAPLPFEAYATQLDLFSCETGFAVAECLALHEKRLASDVVRQADLQLQRRIFEPFLNGSVFYRFEAMSNNWSSVCGSAIGGAALRRLRDNAALTSLLHRCFSCLDVYLESFGDDGVCVEGVGYWTYGFGFYCCFADLLVRRTDGALDLLAGKKAKVIALCQQQYYLTGGQTVSFADGSATAGFRMGLSCYLQRRFPEVLLPDARYAAPVLADDCYRYCLALRDFLWESPDARFGLPLESNCWLPDAQWFLSRGGSLALAAKAGHNGESHNHNDCGSLILCKNGEPLLCDMGAGLYDAAYFGPKRYHIFVNASRSHSVPLVAGTEQCSCITCAAREVAVSFGGDNCLSMELAGCYAVPALQSLRRTITHHKAAGCVSLCDVFRFSAPQTVTEVFVSLTPIHLHAGGAEFLGSNAALRLSYDEALFAPALREESFPAPSGELRTAFLLHLTNRTPQTELCCAVTLI